MMRKALSTITIAALMLGSGLCLSASTGKWTTSGYTGFAAGQFGNGGQNIYVSRAGVLQRIHRFDFNADGWADILFVNAHDFNDTPPSFVCDDVFGKTRISQLPGLMPASGAMGDVDGDGFDDFVLANRSDGVSRPDIPSYLYYGSPEGLSERYKVEFPTYYCSSAAIGDFNGDGKQDIAFSAKIGTMELRPLKLRIFYRANSGYLPSLHKDYDVRISGMSAADLDKDGFCDLYAKISSESTVVFWGSKSGLDIDQRLNVLHLVTGTDAATEDKDSKDFILREQVDDEDAIKKDRDHISFRHFFQPKVVFLDSIPYLFTPGKDKLHLYPVKKDRSPGTPIVVDCPNATAVAAGDINGDGYSDLAVAVCNSRRVSNDSCVYWGGPQGFSNANRSTFSTLNAIDITVEDLDADGCADIAIAQAESSVTNETESLVFKGGKSGLSPDPVRIETLGCQAVLAGKTTGGKTSQLVFVNSRSGRLIGDVNAYAYYGGPDGFRTDRRAELPSRSAGNSICYDYSDDGRADIVLWNSAEDAEDLDPGSYLYTGSDEGFSPDRQQIIPTETPWAGVVGDFRHTGYLDLFTVNWTTGEIVIFRGKDGGIDMSNPQRIKVDSDLSLFTRRDGIDTPQEPIELTQLRNLFVADYNNDGWLDVFMSEIYGARSFIMWGGAQGFSMDRTTALNAEGIGTANAADLDGDGWLDLVLSGYQSISKPVKLESYIYIYWGGRNGYSDDRRTDLPSDCSGAPGIADFNKDGILDIFSATYMAARTRDTDSYIYWGQPGGVYSTLYRSRLFSHSASGCMAADFNRDGWIDLAVANHRAYGNHNADSFVFWNGPSGFSEERLTKLPTVGPQSMLLVDPGNVMDRGPEEYYISDTFQLPSGASVTEISWETELQKRTWVRAQLRFAQSRDALERASWQGPNGSDTWFENGQSAMNVKQSGKWVQYRLALGAENGGNTPRVTSVTVVYEKGN